jgi:hypothetical protein
VIGLALLAGMVLVGAAILVSTGLVLLDDLEEGAQTEQTESSLAVTNSKLSDAAASDEAVGLPSDALDGGSMTVEEDTTTFKFTTVDACSDTYSFDLNSLVYTDADRTWVLEGGARWEIGANSKPAVSTPPDVGYEDGRLSINLITFDETSIDQQGDLVARQSGTPVVDRDALMDAIRCHGGPTSNNSVRITVNSTSYIHAWDQHLRDSITGAEVTYYGPNNASTPDDEIQIVIDNLVEQRQAEFALTDVGSTGTPHVTFDDGLQLAPTLENIGDRNGSAEVSLTVNSTFSDDSHTWTTTTSDVDSGDETTPTFDLDGSDFSNIGDVDASTPGDLSQYGKYRWNVTVDGSTSTSTFFLSYANRAVHRLEDLSHTKQNRTVTVAANLTNVGNVTGENQLRFSLEGESEGGSIEIDRDRTFDIETEPWNKSTFTIDINRSRLPYGTYTYTVDLTDNYPGICSESSGACEWSGQFTLSEGGAGISDLNKVRVNEPSNVSVSVIGTEITFEYWDYEYGEGLVKKRGMAPVTATAVVGDQRVRFTQDGVVPVDDPHEGDVEEHNLNTVGTRDEVYDYDTTLDEGSVTIEATYWDCDGYEYVNTDTYEGTTYKNYECTDFDEDDYTQVTITDGGGTSNNGFLMTRDSDRNEVPRIDNVLPRQRTLSTVFQDGTEDIELQDGELTLGQTDFAFMMETTTTQSSIQYEYHDYADSWTDVDTSNQTAMNLAAWDIAQNEREPDETDPDFNDVIGLVQINPGEEYVTLDDPLSNPTLTGEQLESGGTDSSDTGEQIVNTDSDSVSVDVDEIIIE